MIMVAPYVTWGFKEDLESRGYQGPGFSHQYGESGSLLTHKVSDQTFKHLLDFYQQQLEHYSDSLEDNRTLWDVLVHQKERPEPRELAYEDLQRMVWIYQQLSGANPGYTQPLGQHLQL